MLVLDTHIWVCRTFAFQQIALFLDGFDGDVNAVSYTHLDVYKRQALNPMPNTPTWC